MPETIFRSGVVCIIGRPSAGKSTFLNNVCGEKVSIVSALPQTTRSSIRGIFTAPQGQIIFIDTPGYHLSEKKMNRRLQLIAENRLQEAEAVLYLIDAARPFGEEEVAICALLKNKQERLIVGINKTDSPAARPGQTRISVMQTLEHLPQERIFELSAQKRSAWIRCLPLFLRFFLKVLYCILKIFIPISRLISVSPKLSAGRQSAVCTKKFPMRCMSISKIWK